ncbi:MAG: translation initiation factor IF-2 N-terminal domain-containing protein, partial [Kiritimatiellae bacterium]|nr:translation initiation factor IF-2 N-terminal domain-containing protein [Kiritimatiellia bacterium]
MRVYELAKEAGVTSAALLKAAADAELDATSAISVLDDGDAEVLRKAVAGLSKTDVKAVRAAKAARAAALGKACVKKAASALDRHLGIARAAADGKSVDTKLVIEEPGVTEAAAPAAEQKPAAQQPPVEEKPAAKTEGAARPQPLRMAPGVKPKIVPSVSATQTGLRAGAGFRPLQKAKPAASITITVATKPP